MRKSILRIHLTFIAATDKFDIGQFLELNIVVAIHFGERLSDIGAPLGVILFGFPALSL
jgi:hypothetical protein